jgi:hypothetical protein
MAEKIDLKEIEKKAYKTTLQDGLIDIEIGILFVGMGINSFFYDFVSRPVNILGFFIVGIIAVMPLLLGKKFIVKPRIGIIKFGPKRKAQKKKIIVFSLINTLILVIILILTINSLLQQIPLRGVAVLLVIGLLFATLPLSILAYLKQFPRLFVYGLLIGFGLPFAEIFEFGLNILLIGVIILIVGIISFVKFLKKYPLPEKEVP